MTTAVTPGRSTQLRQRLAVVAAELAGETLDEWLRHDPGTLLDRLVQVARRSSSTADIWLVLTALTGAFPTVDLVLAARRALELKTRHEATQWLLENTLAASRRHGHPEASLLLVTDRVVVDTDFTARHDLLTGIQRVVRETVPRLAGRYDVAPVAWTAGAGAFRALSSEEHDYLLSWPGHDAPTPRPPAADEIVLVVPWRTHVLLPEVPSAEHGDRLAALARFSGNRTGLVGYDCIPVVSGDLVPAVEREKFGRYLEVVKHADSVAAISESSAREFRGFCRALGAQGLAGPGVSAVPLPNIIEPAPPVAVAVELGLDGPIVLCVGSLDPRKNQMALLEAAETLWQQGLSFSVLLIGGGGAQPADLMQLITRLQQRGRALVARTSAPEPYLRAAYAAARFTVFPSLHEGFGLPIVESLSHGVPVVTSDFGSMRELADGQGGVLVDPMDVDELAGAIRRLLTDDTLLEALRGQAAARPVRTWDDYATELWNALVETGDVR